MAVAATAVFQCKVVETLEANTASAAEAKRKVTHDQFDDTYELAAATTPPATKVAAFEQNLSAGAATINLAALTGTNGATVDLTGLKVQIISIEAKAANANPITIVPGASNGIDLFGASSSITLQPGQRFMWFGNDAAPDVASGDRTLDLSGTGSQGLNIIIVAG